MTIRIVTPTTDDEWEPFDRVVAAAFGETWSEPKPEDLERSLREVPLEVRIGVMVDDTVAAGCASYEFDLSLPGGEPVPVAGLTAVGGNPAQRGSGAFRALMVEHLERARARGQAASTLMASESGLYGRFGYGHATSMAHYELDSDRAQLVEPIPDPGSFELVVDLLGSASLFAEVYDACFALIPGTGARDADWWQSVLGAKAGWRGGGDQLGVVHRDADGNPDGYLLYRMKQAESWIPGATLAIRELLGTSVGTELALLQFACDVPLQRKVRWQEAPVDHPLRHHLADPRQLHVIDLHDMLWVRPLDVPTLLTRRSYEADVSVVIEIDDDLFADQRGPWRLAVADGSASVTASSDPVDITLTPEQLGMILLGDHRVQELAHAGILSAAPIVLRQLDHAFTTPRRPYNLSKF